MVREQVFCQDYSLFVGSIPLEILPLRSEAGTIKITTCQRLERTLSEITRGYGANLCVSGLCGKIQHEKTRTEAFAV